MPLEKLQPLRAKEKCSGGFAFAIYGTHVHQDRPRRFFMAESLSSFLSQDSDLIGEIFLSCCRVVRRTG